MQVPGTQPGLSCGYAARRNRVVAQVAGMKCKGLYVPLQLQCVSQQWFVMNVNERQDVMHVRA